jgi:hypothetical protein
VRQRVTILLVAGAFLAGLIAALIVALMIVRRGAEPKFANTPSVIVQIQALSELVTVKYVVEKVVFAEAAKTTTLDNLLPGRDDKLTLLALGVVKAGVDLSGVRPEDVSASGGSIRITIPRAALTDQYLDEKATQVMDRRTGLLRAYDQKLEQQARQEALNEIVRAARVNGIVREADERARQQITTLLKSLGYQEVEVRTRTP